MNDTKSSGVSVPFNEQGEMLAFIRQERERELARDPVHFYALTAPDGSAKDRDVYEMHQSRAAELNEERMFAYMRSQRKREEERLARIARWRDEEKIQRCLAEARAELAAKAATAEIPLPPTKAARELLEHRQANPVMVEIPAPAPVQEPPIIWNDSDYLWVRTAHTGGPIITMPNTRRCEHD